MDKTRQHSRQFEITDSRRLHWYAALFDEVATIHERNESGELVTYQEVLRRGCFADSLRAGTDVTANIDHNDGQLFARTSDGSLLLQEDPKGLFCSCWLPEGERFDRIIADVEAGKLSGASFRFSPVRDRTSGGIVERLAVTLRDVCLTSHPAYPQTEGEVFVRTREDKTRILFSRLKLAKIKSRTLHNFNPQQKRIHE